MIGGDESLWASISGMEREEAAEKFLEQACPLIKRTDNRCEARKRKVEKAYEKCVEEFTEQG